MTFTLGATKREGDGAAENGRINRVDILAAPLPVPFRHDGRNGKRGHISSQLLRKSAYLSAAVIGPRVVE